MPKKEVAKRAHNEHMALDAAMDELVKQTDALLQETAATKPQKKPQLPKKGLKEGSKKKVEPKQTVKVVPHKKGAHLDIVGHAASSPKRAPAQNEDVVELLPTHAGLSYNEQSSKSSEKSIASESLAKASATNASIIKPHAAKRLTPTPETETGEANLNVETSNDRAKLPQVEGHKIEHITVADNDVAESVTVAHGSSQTTDSGDENKHNEKKSLLHERASTEKKSSTKPHEQSRVTDAKTVLPDEPKADDAHESIPKNDDVATKNPVEDGIVKIKEDDTEQKTAYDVAEYQAQLHDWSKLSSNSHWSVVVLTFLLVVAGGLMYLYFTNQLPNFF